jgi:anaerobic magnesium-protoporphyrin IX monomethyl ester cyclase
MTLPARAADLAFMRVLLLNVPHPSIGSRIPDDHLPPLGLLSIGGPLIDDGHEVRLLDADLEAGRCTTYSAEAIAAETVGWRPDAVLFGHSGSTSAHPVVAEVSRAVRRLLPRATIVYGGVFPTYHWREILEREPQIDVIVRGEGERTCVALFRALQDGSDLRAVPGLALRTGATPPAPVIVDLDRYRVGWELIDHRRYSYWGGMRAVVVQFSRGCPHPCTYCGQRGFWTKWRYRDPVKFAGELARLYREHGVELINFADENPTVDRQAWKRFLEALIAENVPLTLVGSTRADDIVRDSDLLPLYRKAGWVRFLLGMENTDEDTLKLIRKGGSTTKDREAIRLLRDNGILSMATWVAGFEEDDDRSFWRGLRQLLAYDPDQIQALYVTPHRWTPYFRLAAFRRVIQDDVRRWDYKHQVLSTRHLPPWRVLLWVKAIEALVQLRPQAIWRTFFQPDGRLSHGMRWYAKMGRRVWFFELRNFLFRDRRMPQGPSLEEFWGTPQDAEERSMQVASPRPTLRLDLPGRPGASGMSAAERHSAI